MNKAPTVVSCLTPAGAGAIAVVAIRGTAAWPALRALFRPTSKKPLPEELPPTGTVWFGHLGADGLADEVVVTVKETHPQPWLDVHCHGGVQVIEWLTELLCAKGVRRVDWSEFLCHVETESRAIAWEALAQAETVRTAAILLDQVNGAIVRALDEIHAFLESGDHDTAIARIDAILKHERLGAHLTKPWQVVVAGAPNVGKSSLMNAVAGYQRSVVAPVPGTTRDVVTTRLAIDGWPVELSDTAGLRADPSGLEREGIDLARSRLEAADLILWVLDGSAPPVWPEATTVARNPLFVVNKTDLPAQWDVSQVEQGVRVSALTGEGVSGLCKAISRRLVPNPPVPGDAVPFGPCYAVKLTKLCDGLPK